MQISVNDVDKVSNGEKSTFFKLTGNHDKAVVRFLHEGLHDIPIVVVHDVYENGRSRWANCLRHDISSPRSECPFCSSKDEDTSSISTRVYLEMAVYELDKNGNPTGNYSVKIWERGKKFISKIQSLCNRYKPLCDTVFEIERLGEEKATDTTYEIYPISGATKEEYPFELSPEPYNPVGEIVLDKTFEEAQYYSDNNEFPPKNTEVQRRGTTSRQEVAVAPTRSYSEQTTATVEHSVNTSQIAEQTTTVEEPTRRRRF